MKTDNELIAEFMGLPLTKEEVSFSGGMKTVPFQRWKYHGSWDWLMPVVEKIKELGYDTTIVVCGLPNEKHRTLIHTTTDIISDFSCDSLIESTYKSVVEFIKWYNSNPELLK